jgi:hypothetical protein
MDAKTLTPDQRAIAIITRHLNPASYGKGLRDQMRSDIAKAIAEHAVTAEQPPPLKVITTATSARLLVWNPDSGTYWESNLIDTKAHF